MAIQYTRLTDDLRSVLTFSGEEEKKYKQVLEVLQWKKSTSKPEPVERATEEELKDLFKRLFSPYLTSIGLQIGQWETAVHRDKIYFREEWSPYYFKNERPPYFEVFCQEWRIIKDKPKPDLEPILNFFIATEKPSEIKVASFLRWESYSVVPYLIQLFRLYCWDLGNLTIKPTDDLRTLLLSPITQLTEFLKKMKVFAEYLGEEKIKKLEKAKDATLPYQTTEFKEAAKDHYARILLEVLGIPLD